MKVFVVVTYTGDGMNADTFSNRDAADEACETIYEEIGQDPEFYSVEVIETTLDE